MLEESYSGMTLCETRMNLVDDFCTGALKQSTFIASLVRDPKWKKFLSDRTAVDKIKWEQKLTHCNDNKR